MLIQLPWRARHSRSQSDSSSGTGSENKTRNSHTNADDSTGFTSSGVPYSMACSQSIANVPQVKRLVVQQSIKKLLTDRHFSICTLDTAMEIVGAQRNNAYTLLRALHCVDYAAMDKELLASIPHLVNECMTAQVHVVEATNVALNGVVFDV